MASILRIKRSLLLTGLIAASAALLPSAASAQAGDSSVCEGERLITTDGYGEVRVAPDSLRLDVGAEFRAATLEEARNEVNTRMQAVIQALQALNIQGLTLQTQFIQISPVYAEQEGNAPPQIIGYSASNRVTATLLGSQPADLGEQASRIIDSAVDAGGNVAFGIDFFLNNPSPARGEALAKAVADARSDATAVAQAAGVTLAGLHSVEESPGFRISPLAFDARKVAEAGAATSVEIGEIVIAGSVAVRFMFTE